MAATVAFAQGNRSIGDDVLFWSKSDFTIPFQVEPNGQQPTEVQLETSHDAGQTWSVYARDGLQSRQFRFSDMADGLYLFRIKTVDRQGNLSDAGGVPLKIMVDTKSPELSLSVDTNERGEMLASFVMRDVNLAQNGVKLEYQTDQNDRWTNIPVVTQSTGVSEASGEGTWEIPFHAKQLVVRLVVRDAAGNESEITRLPTVPKTALGSGNLQLASGLPKTKVATNGGAPRTPMMSFGMKSDVPMPPPTVTSPSLPVPRPSQPLPTAQKSTRESSVSKPPIQLPPIASNSKATSSSPYALRSLEEIQAEINAQKTQDEVLTLDGSTPGGTPDQVVPNQPQATNAIASPNASPMTEKPFYSSSKAFSLDYEVDGSSASPIAAIELWGTADGGKLWERWGTDPDGASPFDIKVETEGLFGFRMVVVGANGLAGNRPRNGDNADAWIHVDTQIPVVRIHAAQYGKGAESGSMIIEYSARDDFFGERPVTFSFSELPSGPWTTIAIGVRNTGRFVWPADPNLPRRVYLKIEANDEAGNVGEHRLDVPVDIEGLAPRGRIHGFRPLGKS